MIENDIHDFYKRYMDAVDNVDLIPDDENGGLEIREELFQALELFLAVFNGEYKYND